MQQRRRIWQAFDRNLLRKRDLYAGALIILVGLFITLKGPTYRTGTLMHMGPGFMPTALGVILLGLGAVIALSAVMTAEGKNEDILPEQPEWWGWTCILASPFAFIFFGTYGGLIPAIFACVFVAAMGDRGITYKAAAILSAAVTAFGVGLFHYVLQIPMAILEWRGF